MKKHAVGLVKLLIFSIATLLLLPIYMFTKFGPGFFSPKIEFNIRSFWSKLGLSLCNIQVEVRGKIVKNCNVYVCNHVSWLDILTIQSLLKISFVAKSEVKKWPIFGFLARIADTVFIERRATAAKSQQIELLSSLNDGKRLCLFPEGTSTDGSYILPFKSSLFEIFFLKDKDDNPNFVVQPISLIYLDMNNKVSTSFGWWGDMNLVSHIYEVVINAKSGTILVVFEEALDVKRNGNRKKLALEAEQVIKKRIKSQFLSRLKE